MARTVVAIFNDFLSANSAVRELVDDGFERDNISIIANNSRGVHTFTNPTPIAAGSTNEGTTDENGSLVGGGAGIGAAIGGIGGLLIGLGALVIPGLGPVIAAGPLVAAISTITGAGVGAAAGGVTGSLLNALIGLGIPEEDAGYFSEGVRRGGVLVTMQAEEDSTEQIMSIFNHHNPVDLHERAAQWREQGWAGNDPKENTQKNAPSLTETR